MRKMQKSWLCNLSLLLSLLLVCNVGLAQVDCDGADGYLYIADQAALETPTTEVTIYAWARTDDYPSDKGDQGIMDKVYADSAPWVSYGIKFSSSGGPDRHGFIIGLNSNGLEQTHLEDPAFSTSTWYCLVGRWKSGEVMSVDVWDDNGTKIGQQTTGPFTDTIKHSTGQFRVCAERPGDPIYLNGEVGEGAVWKKKFDDDQAANLCTSRGKLIALKMEPDDLVLVLPLNDYVAGLSINTKTFKDLGPNGFTLTGVDTGNQSVTSANTISSYPPD